MGCGSSMDMDAGGARHPPAQTVEKVPEPVRLEHSRVKQLVIETLESARVLSVPALLKLFEKSSKIVAALKVQTTADDPVLAEIAEMLITSVGRAADKYESLPSCVSMLEECGSRLIRKGVGNRFFRQYGESLVTLLEAQPPPTPPAAAVWTAEHGHAWRQLFLDLRSYVAAGVSSGRPAASSPTLASSAAIVAAAWREHVADNVGDCGVKAYLAMFKNDPETLSVFFFKDSTNLAKDGRMREHVTKSFTVTGSMINLANKPAEFRDKMERLGAAHGMKGVNKAFVEALGRGILVMLAEVMEDDFTPQVEAAFKRVLKEVAEMFDSGLKLWKSGAAPSASITGCAPPEFRRDYYQNVIDQQQKQQSKPRSLN